MEKIKCFCQKLFYFVILTFVLTLSSLTNTYSQSVILADYYFDAVNGNDLNTGTSPNQAWKTANKFNNTNFPPGSIIAFRDSMEYKGYFNITESGTAESPIVITNWYDTLSNKLPFIEGGTTQNITNGNWVEVSSNKWRTTLSNLIGLWFVYSDSSVWAIRENSLDLLDEEFEAYWQSPYLYIYSPQNPSIRYPKILTDYGDYQSLSSSCFTVSGKYVYVKNLEMGYTHSKALKFMWGSDYSKAINVTVKFTGTARMKDRSNGEGGDAIYISASNITVEKCTTYESSGHGFSVWGTSQGDIQNVIFDGCIAYNNHHTVGVDINSQTGKIRNVHIKNSLVYTTVASYWRSWQYFGSYQGGTPGIFMKGEVAELVKQVYIYNNIFKHITGPSIQSESNADSVYIYNNTFVETDSSQSVEGYMRNWCIYASSFTNGGLHLKNNIFYAFSNVSNNYIVRAYKNTDMSNNLAYRLDGSSYLIYPYDSSYVAPINADPEFVNYQYLDFNPLNYRLQSTSPAINAGADLGSPFNYDRLNVLRPQGSAWDIGAFEYVGNQINQDIDPPEVVSATLLDSITVNVTFSEPMDQSSVTNPSNYSIDNGIVVNSVQSLSAQTVRLNTSVHLPGFYTVTVNNVTDTAGNIISEQQNSFLYGYNPDPLLELKLIPNNSLASAISDTPYVPQKTFDGLIYNSGDPTSRWAASGLPQWIVYDLGDAKMLNKTRIQFYNWNQGRIYNYSIQVSTDSVNWTYVKQNVSSTNTEWTEEVFDPTPARYVKIIVHSNNQNNWASLWEAEFYGNLLISGNDDLTNVPKEFKLEQNYPNPFNPTTKIRYSIPSSTEYYSVLQKVTLKVYDILGNEIATLVDDYKLAGNYEVDFNASDIASGVYIYRLFVQDLQAKDGKNGVYTESKKMLLMR